MESVTGFRRPAGGTNPLNAWDAYGSTVKRTPKRAPVRIDHTLTEVTGPAPGAAEFGPSVTDLTHHAGGEAVGERMTVSGFVVDEDGRPLPNTVIEIWQCNAAGRYAHPVDQHDAPLDPHFLGVGHAMTDADGAYRFLTVRPGAYPWRNHKNAWRPPHIHFGLFGPGFATRLITQMYFAGDPLLPFDPIYNSIPDAAARERLCARFEMDLTQPEFALGYRFDFVLRGRDATPMET
ncbi:MAG: protocatechuate 3,4-dioxygenase subunit beta [Rhodospirillaceae bacterium]|nr:protocatechuate 3,4-dioxygenase subunit beta [Rhodospirillaceae bacterium]|tara:strand:+ start:418 stop:1122 length:705 start_codon:yes stop_codon:yes gene_type:complete